MGRRTPPPADSYLVVQDLSHLPLLYNGDTVTIKEDTMTTNSVPPPPPRVVRPTSPAKPNPPRRPRNLAEIRNLDRKGKLAMSTERTNTALAEATDPQPPWWRRRARREWRHRWGLTP